MTWQFVKKVRPLRAAILAMTALLIAGCLSDSSAPISTERSTSAEVATSQASICFSSCSNSTAPVPVVDMVDVDGHIGAQAFLCHSSLPGTCLGDRLTTEDAQFVVAHVGMRLIAANLTATWVSETPATANLTLEIRVVTAETATKVSGVTGTSPLVLTNSSLASNLPDQSEVRVFAYNARGYVPAMGGFLYATPDQAVHLAGTLSFVRL